MLRSNSRIQLKTLSILTGLVFLGACSKAKNTPIVSELLTNEAVAPKPAQNVVDKGSTTQVTGDLTLKKSEILGREFLYGSDLQYSSISEEGWDLTLQALAIGHVPAKFQIVGRKLQLIADQSINFESDINHPGRLIADFDILSETQDYVNIRIERASPTLVTVLMGEKATRERTSWIRSIQFVEQGNYLMWESSIEGPDGTVAEFMESVFPRATLVSSDDKPLLADSAFEDLAKRFRFLDMGPIFMDVKDEGRVETRVASRFKLEADKPLLWYVTPNVPTEYLEQIRTGIEGWNRYSQNLMKRDIVKFAGILPSGVKIGDPRFNVISWDSVAEAGAAYESQAADPLTGIQSHSLIYLPLAWINIGRDYWEKGGLSDQQENAGDRTRSAIAKRSFLGRKLKATCIAEAHAKLDIRSLQQPEDFAKELLKGVLLHEMGHALGLAHNFKGSLSMDSDDASTIFTTSIMDYNQFHYERIAYDSVDAVTGPLLEYDRQIISALYNNAADLSNAAVLPACDDAEADDFNDGIDPLCIRYDAGKDPTRQLEATIELVTKVDASIHVTQSLAKAIESSLDLLGDPAEATDLEKAKEQIDELSNTAKGLIEFYFGSGAQSLRYMAAANVRQLYIYKDNILPETYSESQLRGRALKGIQFVAALEKLPEAPANALAKLLEDAKTWAQATPAIKALGAADQPAKISELTKTLGELKDKIESPTASGLFSKIRARLMSALVRVPTAAFYLSRDSASNEMQDFELLTVQMLKASLMNKIDGKSRSHLERLAAATALLSFKKTEAGDAILAQAQTLVQAELGQVSSGREREALRKLLAKLRE